MKVINSMLQRASLYKKCSDDEENNDEWVIKVKEVIENYRSNTLKFKLLY
jgi:hypothetical protein